MPSKVEGDSRIPGMLYILVSFVPWITYWTLCGIGSPLGVAIPLLISSLLISLQIPKRELNAMDLASFVYFGLASVATFILSSPLFVEKSGFLGYLALFLMAITSLMVRKPYTLQVSKRDYPEVYWRERSFMLVNELITAVWALIFLVNSLSFLIFEFPITLILSNGLIAAGIMFSIAFPRIAPAYLASREFKRYDWRVGLPRREGGYDVIIVGSGVGGLTCGALLSKRGYKVLVLEQHYQVGGYCSSFRRKGFLFNAGVEDVSGLWERGPISYLLRELGLKKEDLFVKNTRRYILKGEEIDVPDDLDGLVGLLSKRFPEEEGRIRAFFEEAKRAYEECYADVDPYGVPLPPWLIVKVFGPEKLLNYPKEHPTFYDWMNKTFEEKLDEYFRNEDLRKLLLALMGYLGAAPDEVHASSALTACISYYLHGGYFPRGGAQRFAEALRKFIEDHGGEVLVNHKVERILVERGRVKGVVARGKSFSAPIVVSNANAKSTFLELVGEENLERGFVEYIKGLRMSPSCFMVFLGVDMDLSAYPTLIKNLDDGYELVVNSNADPSLAPRGASSVTILTGARYGDFPERGTEEYLRLKKEMAESLVMKAERVIPGLSEHVVVMDAATPKTFERYVSMPEGAIYAFDQSKDVKRPYFKTPIKGLYLVGASTFPGGGVEGAVISGIICAHDIAGWKST